jgi:hypothetical protein
MIQHRWSPLTCCKKRYQCYSYGIHYKANGVFIELEPTASKYAVQKLLIQGWSDWSVKPINVGNMVSRLRMDGVIPPIPHSSSWCSVFNQLTLWSWDLLERTPVVRPLDSLSAFYETLTFITELSRALPLSVSWGRPIQSTPPRVISLRSILILSNHLRLGLLTVFRSRECLPLFCTL